MKGSGGGGAGGTMPKLPFVGDLSSFHQVPFLLVLPQFEKGSVSPVFIKSKGSLKKQPTINTLDAGVINWFFRENSK